MSDDVPARRRDPTTPEGRAIVTAILDATAILLDRDGYDALTTNAVARVAGVSIGSLYQYLPDKRGLVVEFARRLERDALAAAMDRASAIDRSDPRAVVAGLIDVLLDPRLGPLATRRALLLEVPPAWVLPASGPTDLDTERLLAGVMDALTLRDGPRDVMSFVAFHAVEGAIEGAILRAPARLREAAFRAELVALGWRYVAPEGASLEPPSAGPAPRWPEASAELSARLAEEPAPPADDVLCRAAPTTARGRASFERILEGATELLEEGGWGAISARALAARADVSPATLYRYFPDLRAIVCELARRRAARVVEMVAAPLSDDAPLEGVLRRITEVVVARAQPRRRARRALIAEVPRRWLRDVHEEGIEAVEALVCAQLRRNAPRTRGGEPALLAAVIVAAVEHCVESALVTRPALLDDPRFEDELAELAIRYLLRER